MTLRTSGIPNCAEHFAEERTTLFSTRSTTNHMRREQRKPSHPNVSLLEDHHSTGKANWYLFFLLTPSLQENQQKKRKIYPNTVIVTGTIKTFPGYSFVFIAFCYRTKVLVISVTKSKLSIWHIYFTSYFYLSSLSSKRTFFLWITIFFCPRGILAIYSRSNALVCSSELEQSPYFVFCVCAWHNLGCSTSFMFAIRVLSRQVVSNSIVQDSQGAPAHPVFIGVTSVQHPPKKGPEVEKSIQEIFPCRSELLHVLLPYLMLWEVHNIKQGLYDLFCWWQNLKNILSVKKTQKQWC